MMFFVSALSMLYMMVSSSIMLVILTDKGIVKISSIWSLISFLLFSVIPILLVFLAYYCGEKDEEFRTKRDFWTIKK